MRFYHWLVHLGLYKDILAAIVAILIARFAAWRPLKKHLENQKKITNLLDTNTPGGLSDVVSAMKDNIDVSPPDDIRLDKVRR